MKTSLFILVAAFAIAAPMFAESPDTELKVQRRTLDRQEKVSRPNQNAYELTRGLRVTVKNTSLKPLGEGVVEWAILVDRPGPKKTLLSSGKEKLKPLNSAELATFDVGAVPVQENGSKQQEMEFQVILRREGAEVARVESSPKFSQLAEAARSGKKKGKERQN